VEIMRSQRTVSLGVSLVHVSAAVAALGAALAACAPPQPTPRRFVTGVAGGSGTMTDPTGAAGDVGAPPPPVFVDGGVATPGVDGGSTCVNGVAVAPTRPPLPAGPQPSIPATPTKAATPVPPLSGGTLLVLADGTAVASDPERDQVYLVDVANRAVRAAVLQPGDEPGRVVQDAAGRVHVALRRGGAIATIDPKTATVTARRDVCTAPRGIAYQATGDLLQVACGGGELVSLPAAGGAATRTVTLDRDLRDVVVGANGSLLVSTFRKAQVLVVGADGTVSTRLQPGSGLVPNIVGRPQTRTPSVAWRMVPYGSTNEVVMLHQTGITDTIDPAAGGYAGLKGCGGIVQPAITVLSPDGAAPPVAGGLGSLSLAVDLAVSPDQSKIALAVAGNTGVPGGATLVEGSAGQMTSPVMAPCGPPASNVQNVPAGQVVAVSYSQTGVLYAQTREPATLWTSDMASGAAPITLSTDGRTDTGHMIFHVNAGGGLACASCHPEGGEDGRVWNFVCAGARRTQSIRGGISATAPFHWDGSEHDFSHLMDDVFSGRMAGPVLSDDQKNELLTWVDSIPALPATAGLDSAAVVRGSMLFNDAKVGCASCHAGALLTNNTTVDVGTGQAMQVPSLRGVSWRAPFMHNGCAATLADRFGSPACSGGDKHGATSTLTAAQIGDLTAYLQSL
jgi:hypothetical protein